MKSKKTIIPAPLNKDKCILFFSRQKYYVSHENNQTLTMKKSGTQITMNGEEFPKEMTLKFGTSNTEVSLSYDGLVLFDTGDLQKELDLITNDIKANIDTLS